MMGLCTQSHHRLAATPPQVEIRRAPSTAGRFRAIVAHPRINHSRRVQAAGAHPGKSPDFSFAVHQRFIERCDAAPAMNEQLLAKAPRWGGRLVAVIGYLAILGMITAGLSLMGLALLLEGFTRADGAAVMCMLSGTVFAALGGVLLVQQLRRTYLDLQDRLRATAGKEVQA
jgi:hypothetical protein